MAPRISPSSVTGIIVLGALSVGLVIDRSLPSTEAILNAPFVTSVGVGETSHMRTGDVTVTDVRTASTVMTQLGTMRTSGVWLVVDLEITAAKEPWTLTGMELASTSGALYGSPTSVEASCRTAQPGVPQQCTAVFEVAPDDLAGIVLTIPTNPLSSISDDVTEVALGIEEDSPLISSPTASIAVLGTSYPTGGER